LGIQKKVFERYGLLYERKRGEFSDGLRDGYVRADQIVERNHLLRLFYTANGQIKKGTEKRLFQKNSFPDLDLGDDVAFDRLYLALYVFNHLKKDIKPNQRIEKDVYAKVFAYAEIFLTEGLQVDEPTISANLKILGTEWNDFIQKQREKATQEGHAFKEQKYYRSSAFERDVSKFFDRRQNKAFGRGGPDVAS